MKCYLMSFRCGFGLNSSTDRLYHITYSLIRSIGVVEYSSGVLKPEFYKLWHRVGKFSDFQDSVPHTSYKSSANCNVFDTDVQKYGK
jgi:hypothetical protein